MGRIPKAGSVLLVDSQRVPKRNSTSPISRMAGSPEMMRYMVMSSTKTMAINPHTKNSPCMPRSIACFPFTAPLGGAVRQ